MSILEKSKNLKMRFKAQKILKGKFIPPLILKLNDEPVEHLLNSKKI